MRACACTVCSRCSEASLGADTPCVSPPIRGRRIIFDFSLCAETMFIIVDARWKNSAFDLSNNFIYLLIFFWIVSECANLTAINWRLIRMTRRFLNWIIHLTLYIAYFHFTVYTMFQRSLQGKHVSPLVNGTRRIMRMRVWISHLYPGDYVIITWGVTLLCWDMMVKMIPQPKQSCSWVMLEEEGETYMSHCEVCEKCASLKKFLGIAFPGIAASFHLT